MKIERFSAKGFRNLCIDEQELSADVNIIFGDNAQGKTNFLEAVYFCAFGRSLRARMDSELVCWGENAAHIRLHTERAGMRTMLDAALELQGKKAVKSISADFIPVRHMKDLFGRLLVVMFSPEDLRLIKAGPSERRRFMDMEICQLSPVYYSDLREYFRALKQRNALLKILQKDRNNPMRDSLSVWDEQLTNFGLRIIKTRQNFVKKIDETASQIHANITQGAEELRLVYKAGISPENYAAVLQKSHEKDIARGTTSDGIHTDDIEFTVNEISVRHFGSQGQQRTAALSAKLAEIEIIKQSTGETPILLLDDVLSELDKHRQKFLLEQICNLQTIVTCTGVEEFQINDYKKLSMHGGKISHKGA
jgi:DNA replication and repair protein RecF